MADPLKWCYVIYSNHCQLNEHGFDISETFSRFWGPTKGGSEIESISNQSMGKNEK